MSLDRSRIESQLALAKDDLSACVKSLEKQGVASSGFRTNPKWRSLNAKVRQIARRLTAVAEIERVNSECAARKAEQDSPEAAAEAPAPEPVKAKKEKKAKA